MSEKLYRLSVVVLLVLILGFQVYGQLYKSQNCLEAIDAAYQGAITANQTLANHLASYEREVGGLADNFNQQVILSNEYIFEITTQSLFMEYALLKVQTECK